jgi:hypothetical protein
MPASRIGRVERHRMALAAWGACMGVPARADCANAWVERSYADVPLATSMKLRCLMAAS